MNFFPPRLYVLQKVPMFQLSPLKVEGQGHLTFDLRFLASKVKVQEHSRFDLQLSMLKVEDWKPNALGLQLLELKSKCQKPNALGFQLSTPKVECQKLNSTFCTTFFSPLFYVNWIDLEFVIHSFSPILLVNAFVFQVSSANKIDLVLIEVPSNLSIG